MANGAREVEVGEGGRVGEGTGVEVEVGESVGLMVTSGLGRARSQEPETTANNTQRISRSRANNENLLLEDCFVR
jgi:hypothetical protein